MEQKPIGVIIITILLIILGAVLLLNGFLGFSGTLFGLFLGVPEGSLRLITSILGLLLGIGVLGVAIATYQLQAWAWNGTLGLLLAAAVLDVILLAAGGGITPGLSLILAIILIVYLTRPSIKVQFSN
ncbi:MAG: hypothetical protein GY796_17085 [Chloroflexi bacterium]|nr:hypothetical protein [Chloroflexota bacterium]